MLVGLARVVDAAVLEGEAARGATIGEPEVVQHLRPPRRLGFLAGALDQPRGRRRGGGLGGARLRAGEEGDRRSSKPEAPGTEQRLQGEDLVQMAMTPQPELLPMNSPGGFDEPRETPMPWMSCGGVLR